jgi:hypothetical protein
MTLNLDHQQRLNMISLLGAQRANVGEMRMFWGIIDRLELNEEEKDAIQFKLATANGMEIPSWNAELRLEPKAYEFSDVELQRMRRIIDEWPHFITAVDRRWLTPLLDQMPAAQAQTQATSNAGMPMM